ncbi:MAG: type II CRISPR-associated endonuclease Cas1 [Lachnospiraceae bacterium]|nr:type II CRISPR-associated endonuclease Cas1 [Lachnospiraceae bacterium]
MAFRAVIVNNHSKLSYKNNNLIYKSESHTETVPISEIDLLIMETTDIAITTALISKLSENNVAVIFCDPKRLPAAQLIPYYGKHDSSLQIQKQIEWSDGQKNKAWKEILQQKIFNQSLFLKYHHFTEKAETLSKFSEEIKDNDLSNREGHSARIFFNTLYGNSFSRDIINDINAGLDYGYTLLMSMFAREIVKCGCLTQIGINHANQFNPFNLASDLMEPFRVVADIIVYENRTKEIPFIKRRLYEMFNRTYHYGGAKMYLTNIVQHYTKQSLDFMHDTASDMPVFILESL